MRDTIVGGGAGLAVIVVSYGSSDLLAENLAATASGVPAALIVVVDNFTSTAERGRVEQLAAQRGWAVCTPDANLGFGGGVNLGVRHALAAGAEHLLLLNPDASIDGPNISRLRERVVADGRKMVAPRILRPDGSVWFGGSDLHLDTGLLASQRRRAALPSGPVEPWLSGAVLMVGRQLWREIGGFDERYFLYWEDVDLSHRILAHDGRLEVVSDAVAVHDEGATHTGVNAGKSDLYYYYNVRNRLLFAALRLEPELGRRWAAQSLSAAAEILSRGGRRQFIHRGVGPVWAALRGTRDGLRYVRRGVPPVSAGAS